MPPAEMIAFGPCWACGTRFAFDPDKVTSVLIDPQTRLAPDLGGDPRRARREPLCPPCCVAANRYRRANGLELLDETDTSR